MLRLVRALDYKLSKTRAFSYKVYELMKGIFFLSKHHVTMRHGVHGAKEVLLSIVKQPCASAANFRPFLPLQTFVWYDLFWRKHFLG